MARSCYQSLRIKVNARKVAQERNKTYLQAQLHGVTFTRQSLDEFEQEYISNTNLTRFKLQQVKIHYQHP